MLLVKRNFSQSVFFYTLVVAGPYYWLEISQIVVNGHLLYFYLKLHGWMYNFSNLHVPAILKIIPCVLHNLLQTYNKLIFHQSSRLIYLRIKLLVSFTHHTL